MRKSHREIGLRLKYGMTPHDYEEMLNEQGGVCAICGSSGSGKRRLAIDHCHESGFVRGILCGNCNSCLGLVGESEDVLIGCINYLRKHKQQKSKSADQYYKFFRRPRPEPKFRGQSPYCIPRFAEWFTKMHKGLPYVIPEELRGSHVIIDGMAIDKTLPQKPLPPIPNTLIADETIGQTPKIKWCGFVQNSHDPDER